MTVYVVDGSGVLVDPNGLNRDELIRLATERLMISEFDTSKLSPKGYRVLLDDANVTLPDGELVDNGTMFRNTFHLRANIQYDIFVPCGGRPEAIDLGNVNKLIKDGKCIIPFIVEGANLFISQDAKLRLEGAGAILFKDASANKGGVTSSSMEVSIYKSVGYSPIHKTDGFCPRYLHLLHLMTKTSSSICASKTGKYQSSIVLMSRQSKKQSSVMRNWNLKHSGVNIKRLESLSLFSRMNYLLPLPSLTRSFRGLNCGPTSHLGPVYCRKRCLDAWLIPSGLTRS